jgi:hypothetical protein
MMYKNDDLTPLFDVRKSMDRPALRWAAHPLTWIAGKPLPGQVPLFGSPWSQLATALLLLTAGFIGGAAIVLSRAPWFWLCLPLCWLLVTSAARKMQVMQIHHCSHGTMVRSKFLNRWIAEILSTMIWAQDYTTYQKDHVTKHHTSDFATLDDPDVLTLKRLLKIEPGMSKAQLWKQLGRGLVSPRLHLMFLAFRLRSNFKSCPNDRKLCSALYLAGIMALATFTGHWAVLFWAWVFPLTIPYQTSAVLQFCSRHFWLQPKEAGEGGRHFIARLTVGRFSGEAAPEANLPWGKAILAWSKWTGKMLTWHLFWRMFVLVNSLPEHDWHHRFPKGHDWAIGPYARQRDLDAGHAGWPPYEEVWGFWNSVDLAFEKFSQLPKPDQPASISDNEFEQTLSSM